MHDPRAVARPGQGRGMPVGGPELQVQLPCPAGRNPMLVATMVGVCAVIRRLSTRTAEALMSPQIARADQVGRDELLDFIRDRHHVVLVTTKRDGTRNCPRSPRAWMRAAIVIATYPERAKTHNASRHPAVDVLVLSDDFGGAWVQVSGTAEVLDLPEAMEPLVDYFRCIAGEHSDWAEYRAAMQRQGKSLIRVTIDRWGRSPPAVSRPGWPEPERSWRTSAASRTWWPRGRRNRSKAGTSPGSRAGPPRSGRPGDTPG